MSISQSKDANGLSVKICQPLNPRNKSEETTIEVSGGKWCFEYSAEDPKELKMVVSVDVTPQIQLQLDSELRGEEIRQLLHWLRHLLCEYDI